MAYNAALGERTQKAKTKKGINDSNSSNSNSKEKDDHDDNNVFSACIWLGT